MENEIEKVEQLSISKSKSGINHLKTNDGEYISYKDLFLLRALIDSTFAFYQEQAIYSDKDLM